MSAFLLMVRWNSVIVGPMPSGLFGLIGAGGKTGRRILNGNRLKTAGPVPMINRKAKALLIDDKTKKLLINLTGKNMHQRQSRLPMLWPW